MFLSAPIGPKAFSSHQLDAMSPFDSASRREGVSDNSATETQRHSCASGSSRYEVRIQPSSTSMVATQSLLNHDDLKDLTSTLIDDGLSVQEKRAQLQQVILKNPSLLEHFLKGTPIRNVVERDRVVNVQGHFLYQSLNRLIAKSEKDARLLMKNPVRVLRLKAKLGGEILSSFISDCVPVSSLISSCLGPIQSLARCYQGGFQLMGKQRKRDPYLELADKIMNHLTPNTVNVLVEELFSRQSGLLEEIAGMNLGDFPPIKKLSDTDGIAAISLPKNIRAMVDIILNRYFAESVPAIKKNILEALWSLPIQSSESLQLASVLEHCGIPVQKLFQLVGHESDSKMITDAMAILEQRIAPISGRQALEMIEEANADLGLPQVSELFESFNPIAIGSATIGSVFAARLKGSNEEVVVKVKRRGVVEQIHEEIDLLVSMMETDYQKSILETMRRSFIQEADFLKECENIRHAVVYEKPRQGLFPVKLHPSYTDNDHYIMMEKAPGRSMGDFSKKDIEEAGLTQLELTRLKKKAAKRLYETWQKNALFRDGFFHADLHGGNVFFQATPGVGPGYRLTLLDLGNAGVLDGKIQSSFTDMTQGIMLGNPKIVWEAIQGFLIKPIDQAIVPLLKKRILKVMKSNAPVLSKVDEIVYAMSDLSIEVSGEFVNFNRGKLFLADLFESINDDLNKLDPKNRLGRLDWTWIGLVSALGKSTRDFPRVMFGAKKGTDTPVKPLKILSMGSRSVVDKMFGRFNRKKWLREA